MTGLDFQAEFVSGREFGLRVRGEGILLLHRVRATLLVLAGAGTRAGSEGPAMAGDGGQAASPPPAVKR